MKGHSFELHPRLAADTVEIGRLPLCRVLLMDDSNFPWLILVPAVADIREIHELAEPEQQQLIREISLVAERLQADTSALKMNVAALGNQVPQLHVHVIARFDTDPAWPAPVWGKLPPTPYSSARLEAQKIHLRSRLGLN